MAEFIFDDDPNLGGVVQAPYKVFCNWSPKTPITDAYRVTRDVCGHKFSNICGFTFTSSLTDAYARLHPELAYQDEKGQAHPYDQSIHFSPKFQVVYVPKSRSNFSRNDKGLSGWYLWQHIAADNKQIMSINDFFACYGFDIAKFFKSDVFAKYLPVFQKQVAAAYDAQVLPFISSMGTQAQHGYTKRDCTFFANCVMKSMASIADVLKTDASAKVAYNADDTYSLNTKGVSNLDQVSGVDATGTKLQDESKAEVNEDEHEGPIDTVRQLKRRLEAFGQSYDWDITATVGEGDKQTAFKIDDLVENEQDDTLVLQLIPIGSEALSESEKEEEKAKQTNEKEDDVMSEDLSQEQKSAALWDKAKAALENALKGYNDVADYCKLVAEAYDFDTETVSDDDEQMRETKADIDKAAKALDDLRKALHFD